MNSYTHISANTQAQKVREELFQLTQQPQWKRDDKWKIYLKGRRDIYDAIYSDLESKDWLNYTTSDLVDGEFKRRAIEYWAAPDEAWVLHGDWLNRRRDIVSWMRSTYWKHNSKRLTTRGSAGVSESQDRPDLDQAESPQIAESSSGSGSGPGQTYGKSWRDVMFD